MKNIYLIFGFIYLFLIAFSFSACQPDEDELIPESCYDGILNQDEVQVDCGGVCDPCDPCSNGELDSNEQWVDCGGECPPCEPCANGVQDADQGETGIDCGGPCGPCADLCDDGLLNGNEEAIDCGGDCDPCPSCDDEILNGQETGIDCGGPECEDCPETAGNCTNGEQDGDEFGVDCGGSACEPCEYYFEFTLDAEADNFDGTYGSPTFSATINADEVVTITAAALNDVQLVISMGPPGVGWIEAGTGEGATVTFSEEFVETGDLMTYIQPGSDEITYDSDHEDAQGTLNFDESRGEAPRYIKGTFNNIELMETGTGVNPGSVTITNGSFYMPVEEE